MLAVERPELGSSRAATFGSTQEVAQEARAGGGETLEDGLVRIADAHPIAVRAGEEAQNGLLEVAAILCLVLEDVGPAVPQAHEIVGIRFERQQGEPDEVLEIHRAAIAEGMLVVGIDGLTERQERGRLLERSESRRQLRGSQPQILRQPHHGATRSR